MLLSNAVRTLFFRLFKATARNSLNLCLLLLCATANAAPPAQLVLVIDDVGYHLERARRLVKLPGRITLGMLPFAPYTPQIARQASLADKEIILHQPMEPITAPNNQIERGTLTLAMSGERFDTQFDAALARVPQAVGVNNHTGSLLTQYHEPMSRLMGKIAGHGLFFLDSRTTHLTVAEATAREWHVPTLRRDVFLDHDPSPGAIENAFDQALRIARRRGHAVVIAHPYRSTVAFLERRLTALPADIELTTLTQLLGEQHSPVRRFDQTTLARLETQASPHKLLGP